MCTLDRNMIFNVFVRLQCRIIQEWGLIGLLRVGNESIRVFYLSKDKLCAPLA